MIVFMGVGTMSASSMIPLDTWEKDYSKFQLQKSFSEEICMMIHLNLQSDGGM
mgnify:FL=1